MPPPEAEAIGQRERLGESDDSTITTTVKAKLAAEKRLP